MRILLRATYENLTYPAEENGNNYPLVERGYTDPRNPWGSLDVEAPEGLCGELFSAWRDEHAETVVYDDANPITLDAGEFDDAPGLGEWVTYDALKHAAMFIADFPGGVWDFRETEYATDYRTGIERGVTLHVEVTPGDDLPLVFARAEAI